MRRNRPCYGPRPRCLPQRGAAVLLLFCALLLAGATSTARGVDGEDLERQVRVGFIYNFLKFTEWPEPGGGDTAREYVVAVYADPGFGEAVEERLKGKSARGRPVRVRRIAGIEDLRRSEDAVHLLFLGSEADLGAALEALRGRPVLTVAQRAEFCQRGGMINLVKEGERLRFEINPSAAQRTGLRLSSKLLSLARALYPEQVP